jgi:hypothetical protein
MENIKIHNYSFVLYFFVITIISILISFSLNYLFLFDSLYFQSFGEKIATDRIAKIIEQSHKWQWLGYVFIPIVVLLRVSFTTICLYTGFFLANFKVRFKDLFKVALLADFVFVLAGLVKLVILIFFKEVNTLNDLQFQPMSLMEVFDRTKVDALLLYPLSLISIFELLYWLTLAWLLSGITERPVGNSLKTVASSYGTGLALWVLFVMFLTVNLS